MNLSEYIKKVGDREFAESIGASRRAVTDWRVGRRVPRPEWARKIVEVHGRKVTMADIYAEPINGKELAA